MMVLFWFIVILITLTLIAVGVYAYIERDYIRILAYGKKFKINYIVRMGRDIFIDYNKEKIDLDVIERIRENLKLIVGDVNEKFNSFFLYGVCSGEEDHFKLLKRHITRTKYMDNIESCLPDGNNKPSYSVSGHNLIITFGDLIEINIPIIHYHILNQGDYYENDGL